MSCASFHVLDALRAIGEPTRLRILALLRYGDLSVGEFVQILNQSQPRLSHHLKTLNMAGLVERLPEGSWVFYRLVREGAAGRLFESIMREIDQDGDDMIADIKALNRVRAQRAEAAELHFAGIAEDWDQLRLLHSSNETIEEALLGIVKEQEFDRIIDLGTGTARMLSIFAPFAKQLEGLDSSHQMLTVARANLAAANIVNADVRQGYITNTPFEDQAADLVIIHQVLHYLEQPQAALTEAARLLQPGGRLLIVDFAPHDHEFLRQEQGHRWLGMRQSDISNWTQAAGLVLTDQLDFAPPDTLKQGLSVKIWVADKTPSKHEIRP